MSIPNLHERNLNMKYHLHYAADCNIFIRFTIHQIRPLSHTSSHLSCQISITSWRIWCASTHVMLRSQKMLWSGVQSTQKERKQQRNTSKQKGRKKERKERKEGRKKNKREREREIEREMKRMNPRSKERK